MHRNWWLSFLIAVCLSCFTALNSKAATMDYAGSWNATSTYPKGKVVKYNGLIYYSLQSSTTAPNTNKIPTATPTWWELIGTTMRLPAAYDATGKLIGPLIDPSLIGYGSGNRVVGMSLGDVTVPVFISPLGFRPCMQSAAYCIPSAANNFNSIMAFPTTDCSGTAYYWSGEMQAKKPQTYGIATGTYAGLSVARSFDVYLPATVTKRTISSVYTGGSCSRMNNIGFSTATVDLPVFSGTFTKTTISSFTLPFYIQ